MSGLPWRATSVLPAAGSCQPSFARQATRCHIPNVTYGAEALVVPFLGQRLENPLERC